MNRMECHLLIKSLQAEDGRLDKKLLLAYLKDPLSHEILLDKIESEMCRLQARQSFLRDIETVVTQGLAKFVVKDKLP